MVRGSWNERQLAQRLVHGQAEAWREFNTRFHRRAIKFFVAHGISDPEEAWQLTLVRFWRARERFDPALPIWPFVRRIATHVRLDLFRLAYRQIKTVSIHGIEHELAASNDRLGENAPSITDVLAHAKTTADRDFAQAFIQNSGSRSATARALRRSVGYVHYRLKRLSLMCRPPQSFNESRALRR